MMGNLIPVENMKNRWYHSIVDSLELTINTDILGRRSVKSWLGSSPAFSLDVEWANVSCTFLLENGFISETSLPLSSSGKCT